MAFEALPVNEILLSGSYTANQFLNLSGSQSSSASSCQVGVTVSRKLQQLPPNWIQRSSRTVLPTLPQDFWANLRIFQPFFSNRYSVLTCLTYSLSFHFCRKLSKAQLSKAKKRKYEAKPTTIQDRILTKLSQTAVHKAKDFCCRYVASTISVRG